MKIKSGEVKTIKGANVIIARKKRAEDVSEINRYFPEPDLLPVVLPAAQVEEWRRQLPELPQMRRERLVSEYGLPDYDAGVLSSDKAIADWFEEAARLSANAKAVSNWVMTEMLRLLLEQDMEVRNVPLTPHALADLVRLVDDKVINSTTAKDIFAELFENGGSPAEIVQRLGLAQVSDIVAIEALVDEVIRDNPKSVADFRGGKVAAAKFLVGQVMKLSKGKANPQVSASVLNQRLGVEK